MVVVVVDGGGSGGGGGGSFFSVCLFVLKKLLSLFKFTGVLLR